MRQICSTCRYWSEGHARLLGLGPLQALCLYEAANSRAPAWTTGGMTCPAWASGHFGAVDGQPDDGLFARRAYAKET